MSTNYYLRRREPMEVYEQTRVLHGTASGAYIWMSPEDTSLVKADGEHVTDLYRGTIPMPGSIDDLRDLLAGGRYDLYDEYGKKCDLEEVMGDERK